MASERILVVPRRILEETVALSWQATPAQAHSERGVLARSSDSVPLPFGDADVAWEALKAISSSYRFANRTDAETDASLKQIIPYVLIRYGTKIMLLKRLREQSERRLWDKYSIGIGGHLNPEDGESEFFDLFLSGMDRELHEELDISTEYACRLVGCINDDKTDVGKVHFGIVFQALFTSDKVHIRETTKMSGEFIEVKELVAVRPEMESWSRIVFDHFLASTV